MYVQFYSCPRLTLQTIDPSYRCIVVVEEEEEEEEEDLDRLVPSRRTSHARHAYACKTQDPIS
jgi:riboflavin synthase